MNVSPTVLKSKAFALRIVKAYQYLQGKKELVMSKQEKENKMKLRQLITTRDLAVG